MSTAARPIGGSGEEHPHVPSPHTSREDVREHVREPGASRALGLGGLWEARELFYFLVWRDVKVRYKQTVLGAGWALVQPTLMMLIFTLFFGRLAGVPSDGIPYPLFAYSGLLLWQLFATSVADSANSLIVNERLLTRAAFPRLIVPLAALGPAVLDFACASVVLAALLALFRVVPAGTVILVPLLAVLALLVAAAAGIWLSALNAQFRDVRYTVPFVLQVWLFLTPVAYPASLVPERWRLLYGLNPLAGVVEGVRWAVFARGTHPGGMLAVTALVTLAMLYLGLRYFRRVEASIADVV